MMEENMLVPSLLFLPTTEQLPCLLLQERMLAPLIGQHLKFVYSTVAFSQKCIAISKNKIQLLDNLNMKNVILQ